MPLVGHEQMTLAVGAATGVARINAAIDSAAVIEGAMLLLLTVNVPLLEMPVAVPFWIVNLERVTVPAEIVTTVPAASPSKIVVVAPAPVMFRLTPMARFLGIGCGCDPD